MARRKIVKTPDTSTQPAGDAKSPTQWEEYYNTLSHQMAPANSEFRKRMAIRLVEWSKNVNEPLTLEDFIDTEGINPDTYYEWIKRSPELKEAHEFAKRRLANIRLRKGTKGEWNWAACRWSLPFYGSQYLEHEKALESVKQKNDSESTGRQVVLVDVYPSSDLVPVRKTDA